MHKAQDLSVISDVVRTIVIQSEDVSSVLSFGMLSRVMFFLIFFHIDTFSPVLIMDKLEGALISFPCTDVLYPLLQNIKLIMFSENETENITALIALRVLLNECGAIVKSYMRPTPGAKEDVRDRFLDSHTFSSSFI